MNNRVKYIVALVLCVILCLSTVTYGAAFPSDSINGIPGCTDSPDGRHHMKGRGSCRAINVNTGEILDGIGGQCMYCYLLTVTENNLFLYPNNGMGKYATRDAWATVENYFTMEVTSFGYNSSHTDLVGRMFIWEYTLGHGIVDEEM